MHSSAFDAKYKQVGAKIRGSYSVILFLTKAKSKVGSFGAKAISICSVTEYFPTSTRTQYNILGVYASHVCNSSRYNPEMLINILEFTLVARRRRRKSVYIQFPVMTDAFNV